MQLNVIKDENLRFNADGNSPMSMVKVQEQSRTLILNGHLFDEIICTAEPNVEVVSKGNWETCAQMLLDTPLTYCHTGQPRLEAFWRTFIADQSGTGESPAPDAIGDSFFHTLRFAFADRFSSLVGQPDCEDIIREAIPKIDELAQTDPTKRLSTVSSILADCKDYNEMQEKGFEYGNAITRDAEKQSLFMSNSNFAMWRRTYRTSKGYLGLGPETLQDGDLIFIIAGSPVPFVLRKTAVQGRYRLVGETYVHGIMQGQAVQKPEELSWQEVHLE